jgi:hypothetical protein
MSLMLGGELLPRGICMDVAWATLANFGCSSTDVLVLLPAPLSIPQATWVQSMRSTTWPPQPPAPRWTTSWWTPPLPPSAAWSCCASASWAWPPSSSWRSSSTWRRPCRPGPARPRVRAGNGGQPLGAWALICAWKAQLVWPRGPRLGLQSVLRWEAQWCWLEMVFMQALAAAFI